MDIYVAEGGGRGVEIEKGEENDRQSERESGEDRERMSSKKPNRHFQVFLNHKLRSSSY